MRLPLISCGAVLLASTALAEVPHVVTDIAPVHSLVARVMQGVGEPILLVEPGASPHGYALRPSKAVALDRADAVFWIGEGLEPWLEGPLETLGHHAAVIELMGVPGTTVLGFRQGAAFEEHGHDEGNTHKTQADDDHGDHADDAHDDRKHALDDGHAIGDGHDHDHTGMDPHGWLDPMNAHVWLGAVAAELARLDPENADRYAANAVEGQAELDGLVAKLTDTLTDAQEMKFIVFHDAFHYFENRFGLSAAGAVSLSDASEPGAARVAEIRQTVKDLGVSCVFAEPQFNPGLIRAVAEGGVKVAEIDPLGAALKPGSDLYPQLMRDLALQIRACQ